MNQFLELAEATAFCVNSLDFLLGQAKEAKIRPNGTAQSMVEECEKILQSQVEARRNIALKFGAANRYAEFPEPQQELFGILAWPAEQKLPRWEKVIVDAVKSDDWRFFEELGKVLSKKRENSFSRLDYFLANHWTDTTKGHPPLCFFTDETLTRLYNLSSDRGEDVSFDSVRKTRQRLGLVQAQFYHVKSIFRPKEGSWEFKISTQPRGK